MSNIFNKIIIVILGAMSLLILAQCDTTTAEEYKAQAVGYFEQGEKTKAYETYLKAAEKGDSDSQLIMAILYMTGKDKLDNPFPKDDKESLKWLKKSAQQDNELAFLTLGFFYYHGSSVEKDSNKARHYFEKAATANNYLALYYLGESFENENKSDTNKLKAAEYYQKALQNGSLAAKFRLGGLYVMNTELFPNKFIEGVQLIQEIEELLAKHDIDRYDFFKIEEYDILTFFSKNIKI